MMAVGLHTAEAGHCSVFLPPHLRRYPGPQPPQSVMGDGEVIGGDQGGSGGRTRETTHIDLSDGGILMSSLQGLAGSLDPPCPQDTGTV